MDVSDRCPEKMTLKEEPSMRHMPIDLKKKVAKGVVWLQASTLLVTVINFLTLTILARLFSPQEFGVMGMIMVVINFMQVFSDFGLTAAVIQKQDLTPVQLSTLCFLNIGLGVIFFLTGYLLSPLVAVVFNVPELSSFVRTISISFVFISIGQMFRALLQKELELRSLCFLDISTNIIYAVSVISFVAAGFGVRGLVYGFLIFQASIIFMAIFLEPFRPRFVFNLNSVVELVRFGGYIVGERLMNYLSRNLDYIIIGRYLGARLLGYYSLGYTIMLVPVSRIAGVMSQVMFPAFSRIQSDDDKMRHGYLKALKCISLVTFPLMTGLFVYAHEFIIVLFGQQWTPVIPIVRILCVLGALQSIGTTVGTVIYARGRPDIAFKWTMLAALIYAVAFWTGKRWGIVGVAAMYAISSGCLIPIIQAITNNLIKLKVHDFLLNFLNPLKLTAVVAAAICLHKYGIAQYFQWTDVLTLLSGIIVGTCVYMAYLYKWNRDLVREIVSGFSRDE